MSLSNTGNRRGAKNLESNSFPVGQQADVDLSLNATPVVENTIEIPDGPIQSDYMKELAFNEEHVTVQVHETNDENAIPLVDIYVNGVVQFFPRGVPVIIKRKFLEGLVRAKPMSIRAKATMKAAGEEPINNVSRSSALAYPFTVVEDKNPNGSAWLRKIMAEA